MRKYVIFGTVSLALALFSIAGSSVSVAFPVITSDYNTTVVIAGWVLTGYQLVATIMMPIAGKISDIMSRKSIFLVFNLLFVIGSILCALAPGIGWLVAFRVIQGLGGGGFMPAASGIVADEFPHDRQRYIGLFTSIFPIGMIIGPNLGGWMVESFGWRSVFWVNVPLGILVMILTWLLIPAGKKGKFTGNIDYPGIALLSATLIALMFGLTEMGSTGGVPWIIVGVLVAAALVFLFAFIRREQRAKEPVVELELLRRKPFLAANLYNVIYGFAGLGIFSLVPLYAVSVYKLGVFESGLILTSRSVCIIIASTVTSIFLVRWGYRRPILVGTLTAALGLGLMAFHFNEFDLGPLHVGAVALLLIFLGICGIGHGVSTPACSNACIELMPEKVATISGLRGMFRQMGGVFGVGVGTVIINNIKDPRQAFFILFFVCAMVMLISIPSIFAMPASPDQKCD
jgi:EmrB/QacA subfamily drug resistance transporter